MFLLTWTNTDGEIHQVTSKAKEEREVFHLLSGVHRHLATCKHNRFHSNLGTCHAQRATPNNNRHALNFEPNYASSGFCFHLLARLDQS